MLLHTVFATLLAASVAFASEMPPMPPGMFEESGQKPASSTPAAQPSKEKPATKKAASPLPKECDSIPPMVVLFPPPMQKEVDLCRDALSKPKMEAAQSALSSLVGGEVEIISIEPLAGYHELYAIRYTGGKGVLFLKNQEQTLYCNGSVTRCIKGQILEQKGK